MTSYQLTEEQVRNSIRGANLPTDLSIAVCKADELAEKSGCCMYVVKTKNYGLCVWGDFKLKVAKTEIVDVVYNSDDGFVFPVAV